ncbi:hypothetical protein GCM10011519_01370 [Marmoricola endophyticus]|uniref:Uncharacterized protein n=1 Tax=Marmoricola endophyticus TaxID=2040280 RepID=A0A917B9R9_9ACTN|nr:hypothetical protein [Marmoricola endophyticus]GGF31753.1 hypothetical protein GCM10011519_01370 [Marmoricola endophyticus]
MTHGREQDPGADWERYRYVAGESAPGVWFEDGDPTPARWGPGTPFGTPEAARIGLDRNTVEGSQVAFFAHLRGDKRSHKVVAWVALAVLTLPLLLTGLRIITEFGGFLVALPGR